MSDSPNTPKYTRHDGWTAERRRAFIEALGKMGNVRDACRGIGLSNQAAYKLRARDPAFAADWDAALKRAVTSLEAVAYTRAVDGVEEPIFHGGVQVGTRVKRSDALLRILLQAADPENMVAPARDRPFCCARKWKGSWRRASRRSSMPRITAPMPRWSPNMIMAWRSGS